MDPAPYGPRGEVHPGQTMLFVEQYHRPVQALLEVARSEDDSRERAALSALRAMAEVIVMAVHDLGSPTGRPPLPESGPVPLWMHLDSALAAAQRMPTDESHRAGAIAATMQVWQALHNLTGEARREAREVLDLVRILAGESDRGHPAVDAFLRERGLARGPAPAADDGSTVSRAELRRQQLSGVEDEECRTHASAALDALDALVSVHRTSGSREIEGFVRMLSDATVDAVMDTEGYPSGDDLLERFPEAVGPRSSVNAAIPPVGEADAVQSDGLRALHHTLNLWMALQRAQTPQEHDTALYFLDAVRAMAKSAEPTTDSWRRSVAYLAEHQPELPQSPPSPTQAAPPRREPPGTAGWTL
jgi:hypothetical protein